MFFYYLYAVNEMNFSKIICMAQKAVKLCVDLLSKAVNYRWDQKRVNHITLKLCSISWILAYNDSLTIAVLDTLPTWMWYGVEFPDVGYWWLLSGNLGTNSKSWNWILRKLYTCTCIYLSYFLESVELKYRSSLF